MIGQKRLRNTMALVAWVLLVGAGRSAAQTTPKLYGAAHTGYNGPSTLYEINPANGAATVIGPIGFNRCGAMDFNAAGALYATCERTDGSSKVVLVTINPATGAGTEVGLTGVEAFGGMWLDDPMAMDMSFRKSDGKLFAYTSPGDALATVNTATGAMTQLAFPSGASSFQLACFCGYALAHSGTDVLWLAAGDHLFTLNQDNSFATFVRTMTFPLNTFKSDYLSAMDFAPDGSLFAANSDIMEIVPTRLVKVDVSTGAITILGNTVNGLRALAWKAEAALPPPPPPPPPVTLTVQIDIKPEESPNSINLSSRGTVPVAILGSQSFAVANVDVATVRLAGAPVVVKPNGQFQGAITSVNGDAFPDLVLYFSTQSLVGLNSASTEATLEGKTVAGTAFLGTDSVRIVR